MNKKVPAILLIATLLCIAVYIGVFIGRISAGNIISLPDTPDDHADSRFDGVFIDLNTATLQDLMLLPCMNWQLAEEIIQYREKYGDYVLVSELKDIDGMTEEIYEQIKDHLRIYS